MDPLMNIASSPALAVPREALVKDAVDVMVDGGHGAVAIIGADGELVGIFTERDLMEKVSKDGYDPTTTPVSVVMSSAPVCVEPGATRERALELMLERGFRHLPITDSEGRPIAMLSFRDLLRHQIERLRDQVDSLEAYLLADGPGG